VGRHSAPDPEDSADEGVPEEPPTQRFGRQEPVEPDYGRTGYGYRDPGLDRPGYSEPAYPSTAYPDGDFDAPGYDDSGYESGYDEPDYGPDYGEAEYDEPDQGYPPAESARGAVPPPRSSGQKHTGEWDGGEWTGSHRAVTAGRRGVSVGVIAALVAVVVIVGAFIL